MKIQRVKCYSGLPGWRCRLQDSYKEYHVFERYDALYGFAERLGYNTAQEAWDANPWIEGSTNPSDFRAVPPTVVLAMELIEEMKLVSSGLSHANKRYPNRYCEEGDHRLRIAIRKYTKKLKTEICQ